MQKRLLNYIQCPVCRSHRFHLDTAVCDQREIREGQLLCQSCQTTYPINNGIVDLMPNPDPTITAEQEGWLELLGETSEELVATMLKLPYYDVDPLWSNAAKSFDGILRQVDFKGKTVLDIGAGRCWSTRHFMRAGAQLAVGLDILTEKFIGLETADIFMDHDDIYFERIIGDMNDLPIRPESFDIVFMTATLHHTSDPAKAMMASARALKPGGMAIFINEPVKRLFQSGELTNCVEIEHGINENIYPLSKYTNSARQAGLTPKLLLPEIVKAQFNNNRHEIIKRFGRIGRYVLLPLWKYRLGQQLINGRLIPFLHAISTLPLTMIAQKPSE